MDEIDRILGEAGPDITRQENELVVNPVVNPGPYLPLTPAKVIKMIRREVAASPTGGGIAGVTGTGGGGTPGLPGPQGMSGFSGASGFSGLANITIGSFGASRIPSDLPPNGLIPANWDAPGAPANPYQMQVGQGLLFSPSNTNDPLWKDVFTYVGTTTVTSGWINSGNAAGPTGLSGFSGQPGAQGTSGYSGGSGFSGPPGVTGQSGFSGIDGTSGFSGVSGASGISGFGSPPTVLTLADSQTVLTCTQTGSGQALSISGKANLLAVSALNAPFVLENTGAGSTVNIKAASTAPLSAALLVNQSGSSVGASITNTGTGINAVGLQILTTDAACLSVNQQTLSAQSAIKVMTVGNAAAFTSNNATGFGLILDRGAAGLNVNPLISLGQTATAETITPTHTFKIQVNGTVYRVPCQV